MRRIASPWFLGKVLALGILLVSGLVINEAAHADALRIRVIHVSGNSLLTDDEIKSSVDSTGENVFSVRGIRLERGFEQNPLVQHATVVPRLPDTLSVSVVERTPIAVWDSGARQVLVDDSGLVLKDGTLPLPVIRAPQGPDALPGARVDPDAVHIAETVGAEADTLGYAGGWFTYSPSNGIMLSAPGKVDVLLGFDNDLAAKIAAYRSIQRYLDESHLPAQLVDVRFLDRPYFR